MKVFNFFIAVCALAQAGWAAGPTPDEVKTLTKKVADWQITTFSKHGKYRALGAMNKWQNRKNYHDLTWHMGALYAGMNEWRKVSGDPGAEAFLMKIGDRNGWKLYRRPYHADDHTVGQFYLSLYEKHQAPKMIEPTRTHFDWILANPKTGSLEWDGYKKGRKKTDCHDRWGWCDALFMAPPVWARLAKITGEQKYLDFMDQEYHATYDLLWDKEDRLFWRDSSYFPKREKNGSHLYWARGNGWVFGGLALMIPDLPEEWEGRSFYIDLFKQMAERLAKCQREDGTWSMGMLGGVEGYPIKETSGTSFFTFGLAWGMNNGLLDRAVYEPIVDKAWAALAECVNEKGMLGYVQPVGASPGDSYADKTEVYGIGAFLAAGSEVYKLKGGSVPAFTDYDLDTVGFVEQLTPSGRTFCRFVPERQDDFAWENDLIAFRAYGPAAREKTESNGFDCWLKRVKTPIIDKWYGQMKTKSYHTDWGEGHDPYHVGSSAGCGGTGIWLNGKREPLEAYTKQEVIECTPERSQFKLTYEREIDGDVYGEEKTVTIELGKRLFDVHSVFTKNGTVASGLPICIGLTTHDGKAETFSSEENGWIACWETIADSEVGTAAMADPKRIDEIKEVKSDTKDESHLFILMKTDRKGAVDYQAGYGWKKAGEIKTSDDWKKYLSKNEE